MEEQIAEKKVKKLADMPDPLEALTGLLSQQEFIALVMGNYAALKDLP